MWREEDLFRRVLACRLFRRDRVERRRWWVLPVPEWRAVPTESYAVRQQAEGLAS